jgi:hypothetical protein
MDVFRAALSAAVQEAEKCTTSELRALRTAHGIVGLAAEHVFDRRIARTSGESEPDLPSR